MCTKGLYANGEFRFIETNNTICIDFDCLFTFLIKSYTVSPYFPIDVVLPFESKTYKLEKLRTNLPIKFKNACKLLKLI